MEGMQAYGAGKAGGAFDPVTFFQQPQTILRIVSWVSGRCLVTTGRKKKIIIIHISLLLQSFLVFSCSCRPFSYTCMC